MCDSGVTTRMPARCAVIPGYVDANEGVSERNRIKTICLERYSLQEGRPLIRSVTYWTSDQERGSVDFAIQSREPPPSMVLVKPQPFTAPLVNPATNSFWRAKKRMAGGIIASRMPARNTPYCWVYTPIYWLNTTGSVNLFWVWMKTWGPMKLFHPDKSVYRLELETACGGTSSIPP